MPSIKPNTSAEASLCPLCGQPNQCQPAITGCFEGNCWCRQQTFSRDQLDLARAVSEQRCLCQRCAGKANKESSI